MARILDGKEVAAAIQRDVAAEAARLKREHGVAPRLAVVLVGEDPASKVYVGRKRNACRDVGIETEDHLFPDSLSETDLLGLVQKLNDDADVDGILVQLPLPRGIDEGRVLEAIDPRKDIDGFHPENLGRLLVGTPAALPCTPAGVLAILDHYAIALTGRIAVVVGRSRIVGKPVAHLLLDRHATVVIAHSRTRDLPDITRQADVLVVATGRPGLISASHVKPEAVVIDVGMNRGADGRLTGDVDFAEISKVAAAITPVPGGVGPTTVAMLMRNTLNACRRRRNL